MEEVIKQRHLLENFGNFSGITMVLLLLPCDPTMFPSPLWDNLTLESLNRDHQAPPDDQPPNPQLKESLFGAELPHGAPHSLQETMADNWGDCLVQPFFKYHPVELLLSHQQVNLLNPPATPVNCVDLLTGMFLTLLLRFYYSHLATFYKKQWLPLISTWVQHPQVLSLFEHRLFLSWSICSDVWLH